MFCLTLTFDWSRKLVPSSQVSRCKTKNNHDLVAHVFPLIRQLGQFNFELSLALKGVFSFLLNGCCDYFGFSFTAPNLKALYFISFCLLISNNVICCYLQKPFEVVQRNPLLGEIDV